VNSPSNQGPRQRCDTVRHQARLDASTLATLEELTSTFHRKRSAILRYVLQWGLTHTTGWTIDRALVVVVPPVPVLLEPELLEQVQEAAAAHGVSMAAWLRYAMRQVTINDFPESWRAGETGLRSHESDYYDRKFGLRLDEVISRQLGVLTQAFHRPAAELIRQLIAQVKPEDFPQSWHLAVGEHQQEQDS
jgi:hypothetical protein